uniref:Uncharacterized protein n=1 Tax=Anguilla anguilla TaxID=7936 RepID=A0A0E9R3K4_ANGAN
MTARKSSIFCPCKSVHFAQSKHVWRQVKSGYYGIS